jgi:hypothetical protein
MFVVIAMVERCLGMGWALVRRPILSVPVAVYVGLVVWLGAREVHGLLACAVLVLVVWRLTYRGLFERLVWVAVRSSWRGLWVYERRWRSTMILSGLGKRYRLHDVVPRMHRVHCTACSGALDSFGGRSYAVRDATHQPRRQVSPDERHRERAPALAAGRARCVYVLVTSLRVRVGRLLVPGQ